jgi:hypothetical protein
MEIIMVRISLVLAFVAIFNGCASSPTARRGPASSSNIDYVFQYHNVTDYDALNSYFQKLQSELDDYLTNDVKCSNVYVKSIVSKEAISNVGGYVVVVVKATCLEGVKSIKLDAKDLNFFQGLGDAIISSDKYTTVTLEIAGDDGATSTKRFNVGP